MAEGLVRDDSMGKAVSMKFVVQPDGLSNSSDRRRSSDTISTVYSKVNVGSHLLACICTIVNDFSSRVGDADNLIRADVVFMFLN